MTETPEKKPFKVAVVFLNYHKRTEHTQRVKDVNLNNAGYPFELIEIDRLGVAAALNEGIQTAMGIHADAVVTMSNDILMPDNWLKLMVHYAENIPSTGMCGIHVVEELPPIVNVEGMLVHKNFTAFGNVMIPRKVIETIGFFNTDYDPYGMQDGDFAYRLNATGFVNYYIPNLKSHHIGSDTHLDTEYRQMKDKGLAASPDKWGKWNAYYEQTENFFVPYNQEQYIIAMQQYQGPEKEEEEGSIPIIEMQQWAGEKEGEV